MSEEPFDVENFVLEFGKKFKSEEILEEHRVRSLFIIYIIKKRSRTTFNFLLQKLIKGLQENISHEIGSLPENKKYLKYMNIVPCEFICLVIILY